VNGAIPNNWYPTNESYYGYTVSVNLQRAILKKQNNPADTPVQDYGVWRISYTTVSCENEWAGAKDPDALGSVRDPNLQGGVCCPADPIVRPITSHRQAN